MHITTKNISTNEETLCKKFSFPDITKQYQTAIECDKTILGDTIIVKKTSTGPIRLFEIYPIGKHLFQHFLLFPLIKYSSTCETYSKLML